MSLRIDAYEREGVALVAPHGCITAGSEAEAFAVAATGLLDRGQTRLIIDLSQVHRIDSRGIGALIAVCANAMTRSARVAFVGTSPRNRHYLDLARLLAVFDVAASRDEAMSLLGAGTRQLH